MRKTNGYSIKIFFPTTYIFDSHQMVPEKSALRLKKVPKSFLPLLLQPCPHLYLWKCEGVAVAHGQGTAGQARAVWRGNHLPRKWILGLYWYRVTLTCMQYRNQSLCGCHSELWIADSFCGTDQQHQGGSWKWWPALASPF